MNGRIERSGYMEVIQAEIATHRVQGGEQDQSTTPKHSKITGATVIIGWMVYVFAIGYKVLRVIGAL